MKNLVLVALFLCPFTSRADGLADPLDVFHEKAVEYRLVHAGSALCPRNITIKVNKDRTMEIPELAFHMIAVPMEDGDLNNCTVDGISAPFIGEKNFADPPLGGVLFQCGVDQNRRVNLVNCKDSPFHCPADKRVDTVVYGKVNFSPNLDRTHLDVHRESDLISNPFFFHLGVLRNDELVCDYARD